MGRDTGDRRSDDGVDTLETPSAAATHPRRRRNALLDLGAHVHRRARGRRRRRRLRRRRAAAPRRRASKRPTSSASPESVVLLAGPLRPRLQVRDRTIETKRTSSPTSAEALGRVAQRLEGSSRNQPASSAACATVREARINGLDSMNYGVESAREVASEDALGVDVVMLTDAEVRMSPARRTSRRRRSSLRGHGPRVLVISRQLRPRAVQREGSSFVPGMPLDASSTDRCRRRLTPADLRSSTARTTIRSTSRACAEPPLRVGDGFVPRSRISAVSGSSGITPARSSSVWRVQRLTSFQHLQRASASGGRYGGPGAHQARTPA